MAEWLQIHIDYIHKDDGTTARCTMSGDKKLTRAEVAASLDTVCGALSNLSGIPYDAARFRKNINLDRPWYWRIFR